MSYKKVLFAGEAKWKLLEGINLVSKAVGSTIGPKGKNAILDRRTALPIITNDGVSIANWFNRVEDPFINTGVQMIKEVAQKSNEVGDGTTTATVIASYLVNEGTKKIEAGEDPAGIVDGIKLAASETLHKLKKLSKPLNTRAELIQVATISVEDKDLGELVGDVISEVGRDGAVTVETYHDLRQETEITKGIKFEQGFVTPYMITNPFRQEAVLEDVPVLICDHIFAMNDDIAPLANKLMEQGFKGMVLICDDIKGEALATAVKNTLKGIFHFLIIRLPGMDEQRQIIGKDLSVGVGANFIDKNLIPINEIDLSELGHAGKVISTAFDTVIMKGAGTKLEIKNKIQIMKEELGKAISDEERDNIKERIARLSSSIGVIKIGYPTEQELIYKKHKLEDALAATRAAEEEGTIAGGGVALLRLAPFGKFNPDAGEYVFYQAIQEPIRKIIENAGKNPETIIEKIRNNKNPNYGFDAKIGEFRDMFINGIVDPVKVTRKAIENAVSMACMFLSTETLIVDILEEHDYKKK